MSVKSRIEWTDATWSPVTGCTKVSAGCAHCYAEREWPRLSGNPKTTYYGRKFNDVRCHPERLDQPLRWTKPRRIFVNSMSDLFHKDIPFEFIRAVWARMVTNRQHTYMILTKRPERMIEFFEWNENQDWRVETSWPNIWLGVSVENQAAADERIPLLLQTPAAVRFISAEPLLGPIDLSRYLDGFCPPGCVKNVNCLKHCYRKKEGLNWVIVGGESGPGARPVHPDWVRGLRDQCQVAKVPFFFKQWGEWKPFYDRDKDDPDWRRVPKENHNVCRINIDGGQGFHGDRVIYYVRSGKKQAGRILDGREWNEMPEVNHG